MLHGDGKSRSGYLKHEAFADNYNISDTEPHVHSMQVTVAFLKFGSCRVGEAWDLEFGR